jgi:hypothetical protein
MAALPAAGQPAGSRGGTVMPAGNSTTPRRPGPALPAIRRSAALPSTVRAAAALDRPAAVPGRPAGSPTSALAAATTRLPGGLAVAAAGRGNTGATQLGAFVQRSMVVAPPRVSVRHAEPAAAGGGPAVPNSARTGRAGSPATQHSTHGLTTGAASAALPGVEVDGPVIRRSLSGAAHSLFRSLLHSPGAAGPATRPDSAQSGSVGMFSNQPQRMHSHGPDEPAVIRRLRESGGDSEPQFSGVDLDESTSPAMRSRDFDELIDRIVDKLERRITDDLERRGRRHLPEVF